MPTPLEDTFRNLIDEALARLLPAVVDAVTVAVSRTSKFDPDELIDVAAAGELVGKTPAAVRKAAQRGVLPCRRVGRTLRFRRGDLLALGHRR